MKIGFIGLGQMGSGMAANLIKAGHDVVVYNRSAAKLQALIANGARAATQVSDACHGDVVITMLSDDAAVESFAFTANGIVSSLGKGKTHISMSTISVALSEKLTAAHAGASQQYVSAPVFGRPEAAAAAKLFIVTGGPQDAVLACQPLFEVMGQRTFSFGDKPSIANLVKLSGNFMIASVVETLGEAMALVGKAGVDRYQYLDFLTSTLFNAPIYKLYGDLIAGRKFEPAGFAASLGLKDIRLALAAGDGLRVPLPFANIVRDRFLALLAQGGESFDWSAISQLAAKDAGQKDSVK